MSAAARYIPALDGLRAISILLVLAAHFGAGAVVPGGFGVTLFFWISGYLLTGQMAAEFSRTGGISWRGFYLRRALRLLPAAFAYMVCAGLGFVALGGRIVLGGWLAALFYGANYYDLYARYASVLPGVRHPFSILWSLAVEEHFYLIWPMLLPFLLRRNIARAGLAGVCLFELLWRIVLARHCLDGAPDGWCGLRPADRIYAATDARLDSIAWGALAALTPPAGPRSRGRIAAAGLLAASFLIRDGEFREVWRYSVQGAALAVLVPSLLARGGGVRDFLSAQAAQFVGRLSYSLYLWHWAALMLADFAAPRGGAAWLGLGVSLTAALSLACWFCIERPMLKVRRRAAARFARGARGAALYLLA